MIKLKGSMTCNDFLLAVPWHENVWVPPDVCTYGSRESGVSWHGIYVHVTLSKCSYDSAPIMNPDKTTPEHILHFQSNWHDLFLWIYVPLMYVPSCDALYFFFFFFSIHSLGLKVNPIGYLLCCGSLWMFSPCRCYLLPADRAMNSGPKWNSYCYQKHKIPITLGVRSRDKKMKQVLIKAAGVINQLQGPGKKRRLIK